MLINVKEVFEALGDSTDDYSMAIRTAIKRVDMGGGGTVLFPSGNYLVANEIESPKNVNLEFQYGAVLNIDSDIMVSVNGMVGAGAHQIFSGSGTPVVDCELDLIPEWFGFIGDGETDNSEAFDRMISGIDGKIKPTVIRFHGSGTYLLDSPKTINADNIAIYGDFAEIVFTHMDQEASSFHFRGSGTGVCNIRDLIFMYNRPSKSVSAGYGMLLIESFDEVGVKNVHVRQSDNMGIHIIKSGNIIVENCHIGGKVGAHETDSIDGTGIYIGHVIGKNVSLIGNHVEDTYDDGILVGHDAQAEQVVVMGNIIHDCGAQSINIAARRASIVGNTIFRTNSAAIYVHELNGDDADYSVVVGNTISSVGKKPTGAGNSNNQYGIWLQDVSHVLVAENNIHSVRDSGIKLNPNCHHISLIGNNLEHSAGFGVSIGENAYNISISGGVINVSGKDGIRINSEAYNISIGGGLILERNKENGIYLMERVHDISISGGVISKSGVDGIIVNSEAYNINISGGLILDGNKKHGIRLLGEKANEESKQELVKLKTEESLMTRSVKKKERKDSVEKLPRKVRFINITGITLSNNGEQGIYAKLAENSQIVGNIIYGNGQKIITSDEDTSGIKLYNCNGLLISTNTIKDGGNEVQKFGIRLGGINSEIQISGNNLKGNKFKGIKFGYANTEIHLTNNNLKGYESPVCNLEKISSGMVENNYGLDAFETFTHNNRAGFLSRILPSKLDSTDGTISATLQYGEFIGQRKHIVVDGFEQPITLKTYAVTNPPIPDQVFRFHNQGNTLILEWNGFKWIAVANDGVEVVS